MHREQHEQECREKLGEAFSEVHKFLDQFFKTHGIHHRAKLHHKAGIEIVRKMFGDDAALAAKLHIMADLVQAGLPNDENLIPDNQEHYERLGLP